jgi:predicted MFS family arabinose efflux permease
MSFTAAPSDARAPPAGIFRILALACGLIVANIYYAQPLAGPIGAALGLSPGAAGLIVTLTQTGYGAGLLLIVPLGDLIENRRLVLCMIGLAALALLGAGLSTQALPFFASAFAIGLASVVVQMLVPYAAHLAPVATQGRTVGTVTSGLMLGIMLARPVSSFVADLASWHATFFLSAGLMVVLAGLLARTLPRRVPVSTLGYGGLLGSMATLALTTPTLRRCAFYQACLFGAFSLFWTTVPLLLAGSNFNFSQRGIALFALVGAGGAIASPIAGRIADLGWTKPATLLAILAVAASFLMTRLGAPGSSAALILLASSAVLLDFGVSTNLVLGQRAIFALGGDARSRLNGLFLATLFLGGALGSALGGWAYAQGGWPLAASIGLAFPATALVYFMTERRQP